MPVARPHTAWYGPRMGTSHERLKRRIEQLMAGDSPEALSQRLAPRMDPPSPHVPKSRGVDPDVVEQRWAMLGAPPAVKDAVLDPHTAGEMQVYERNVENFIGTVKVPVGLAGPLRVNGLFAQGDSYVPLATTEAALVASYNRGAQLITAAGGCTAIVLNEGVSRAPGFAFRTLREAAEFVVWATSQYDEIRRVAESTTKHGKVLDFEITFDGNRIYTRLDMSTGDASGQNMVTFAGEAVRQFLVSGSPVKPQYSFVESNFSGDKKATAQSFQTVRGRKVCADVVLPAELVKERLHTTPQRIFEYWRMSVVGGLLTGAIGHQGHYANGVAALYIACGQDAACVSETAVGITRFETTPEGDLYGSVTLPNVMVGTVGGGTGLPSQTACLEILGVAGVGKAAAFAEICGALALAGELSIIGALCADEFSQAHRDLARG